MDSPSVGRPAYPEARATSPVRSWAPGSFRRQSAIAEAVFRILICLCAATVLVIIGLIVLELVLQSRLSLHTFGWKFFTSESWDPVSGDFGAWPFVYGTLVSSAVALVIAVPLAVGLALYLNEMCPRWLR